MAGTFFLSIVLLSLAMIFLALKIILKKNGKFPEYRVGHNKNMHKIGITCVKHEELRNHKKIKDSECRGCSGAC